MERMLREFKTIPDTLELVWRLLQKSNKVHEIGTQRWPCFYTYGCHIQHPHSVLYVLRNII